MGIEGRGQLCEDPVEGCAGAAGDGESEPRGFVGHGGRTGVAGVNSGGGLERELSSVVEDGELRIMGEATP